MPETKPSKTHKRLLRLSSIILIILSVSFITVILAGYKKYNHFLERTPPLIELTEIPRGIGSAPVTLSFVLADQNAGLDEVVVRTQQRGRIKEILRRYLGGDHEASIEIEFPGEESHIDEGTVEVDIKVFDKSLWSNVAEKTLPLKVDYRRPRVDVLTTQHNARQGGSQLVFYRAGDEDLAISGIKIENQTFIGFPARGLDKEFDDPSLFIVLYALPLTAVLQEQSLRVFAEDQVGNVHAVEFYNKIFHRNRRTVSVHLNDDFLRYTVSNLAEQNLEKLESQNAFPINSKIVDDEKGRILKKFRLVNDNLRKVNEHEILALLKGPRFESYFKGPFLMPQGSVQLSFGDKVHYKQNGQVIGMANQLGYEFSLPRGNRSVMAANDGIVVFSENIGIYGRLLAIDHGLGVHTLYGNLEQVLVKKGDTVTRGQNIGVGGNTGFARNVQVYFELRVHGVPVDPLEWWDDGWYYSHLTAKMQDIKRMLGIPVFRAVR